MATNFPTSLDVLTTGGNLPNTIASSTELDATNFLHDEMHVSLCVCMYVCMCVCVYVCM